MCCRFSNSAGKAPACASAPEVRKPWGICASFCEEKSCNSYRPLDMATFACQIFQKSLLGGSSGAVRRERQKLRLSWGRKHCTCRSKFQVCRVLNPLSKTLNFEDAWIWLLPLTRHGVRLTALRPETLLPPARNPSQGFGLSFGSLGNSWWSQSWQSVMECTTSQHRRALCAAASGSP